MEMVLPILLLLLNGCFGEYLSIPPIKFLSVTSFAERHSACDKDIRISLNNGKDVVAKRTAVEVLNDLPEHKLFLHPGGCAAYNIPSRQNQGWMFILPAKKKGKLYEDYSNKGKIAVNVKVGPKETNFECFKDPHDSSSKSCLGDIRSVLEGQDVDEEIDVHVKVCAVPEAVADAAVWEINLSPSNDSNKLEAVFEEDAKTRLRSAQNNDIFDTQLTFVSLVGERGAGKSTVASLLSGNDTMFGVGNGATGTTTVGADISPIIPSKDYSVQLAKKLKQDVYQVDENLPLILLDSEGMNVRGDKFDFITTSPPAVIAKVILWLGSGNLATAEMLKKIESYLNGLDNIVLDDDQQLTAGECSSPKYGHFVIVLNKMMSYISDEELHQELTSPEPDYIDGYDKRNAIRRKLQTCFDGLSIHGLPALHLVDGQGVTYDILNAVFRQGLAKIVNTILESSMTPKIVNVGSFSMELNSTNAEVVIQTVITEANKGVIDLTGFESFWTFKTSEMEILLDKATKEMDESRAACQQGQDASLLCSECVCSFRNTLVERAKYKVEELLETALTEATLLFEVDASDAAHNYISTKLDVWEAKSRCQGAKKIALASGTICDISAMDDLSNDIKCDMLFICNDKKVTYHERIRISTKKMFVSESSTLDLLAPPSGQNGKNGGKFGEHGQNGAPGLKGTDLTIVVDEDFSETSELLTVFARGGDGGNGGNGFVGFNGAAGQTGVDGENGVDGKVGAPGADVTNVPSDLDPTNAGGVCSTGKLKGQATRDCDRHCWCQTKACTKYYYYQVDRKDHSLGGRGGRGGDGTDGKPGTNGQDGKDGGPGGNGGNGGKGGDHGDVSIKGPSKVKLNLQNIGGSGGKRGSGALGGHGGKGGEGGQGGTGGKAGAGGSGGFGREQQKTFKANKLISEKYSCNVFHCGGDGNGAPRYTGFQRIFGAKKSCCQGSRGSSGIAGKPGANGTNGKAGQSGKDGVSGKDGENGS